MPFLGPKWPICPKQNFLGTNHYYFHLPIGPFHWAKFKKILTADPELWGCTIYGPKMVHLPLTNFFLENYSYHSHLLMAKILKFFQRIDAQFLGPKWLISPNENFFRKPLNEPCFFHSWLSICQKLKSDINLLVKYWRLKNLIGQETFLANLRKRFFSSM